MFPTPFRGPPQLMPASETPVAPALRIGDVARLVGTTTRTIRYYEEIGLLPEPEPRSSGRHRLYTEAEIERLREIVRLRDLLGVSLDELKTLVEAEDARAAIRREIVDVEDPARRRVLLSEAGGHVERQLELVGRRLADLHRLEQELQERRKRIAHKLSELDAPR
jgi:DNA-binding transcriptional MerR regulator